MRKKKTIPIEQLIDPSIDSSSVVQGDIESLEVVSNEQTSERNQKRNKA